MKRLTGGTQAYSAGGAALDNNLKALDKGIKLVRE